MLFETRKWSIWDGDRPGEKQVKDLGDGLSISFRLVSLRTLFRIFRFAPDFLYGSAFQSPAATMWMWAFSTVMSSGLTMLAA